MKLKYYLRGMGIGIVLTAVMMGILLGDSSGKVSDAEVIKRAKQLGMVEAEDTLSEYSGMLKSEEGTKDNDETASGEALAEDGKEIFEEVDENVSSTGESVPEVDETPQESSSYGESSEIVEEQADIALAGEAAAEDASTETVSAQSETEYADNGAKQQDQTEAVTETVKVQGNESSDTQVREEAPAEAGNNSGSGAETTETAADTTGTDLARNATAADTTGTDSQTNETAPNESEPAAEVQAQSQQAEADVNYIVVVLPGGSESNTCARILRESGVLEDGADFNRYLVSSGLDRKIRSGTKQIPKGASYEEIASIITR